MYLGEGGGGGRGVITNKVNMSEFMLREGASFQTTDPGKSDPGKSDPGKTDPGRS